MKYDPALPRAITDLSVLFCSFGVPVSEHDMDFVCHLLVKLPPLDPKGSRKRTLGYTNFVQKLTTR